MKNDHAYLKGYNAGRSSIKEEVFECEKQIKELKRLVDCKHMRVGSKRLIDGFSCMCLTCGEKWTTKDEPLSEFEKFMKAGMEREEIKEGVRSN
jgi:hypothetical protein